MKCMKDYIDAMGISDIQNCIRADVQAVARRKNKTLIQNDTIIFNSGNVIKWF